MLALASELYYDPSASAEIEALVDEGVRMARRIGDPALLWGTTRAGSLALWTPAYAEQRLALAEEGLRATEELGDETALAIAETCLAGALIELGDLDGYLAHAPRAEAIARRRRLTYVQIAIGWVELNLAALREDTAALWRRAEELSSLRSWVDSPSADFEQVVVALNARAWTDDIGDHVGPLLTAMEAAPEEDLGREALFLVLARAGRVEDLRRLAVRPIRHDRPDWGTPMTGACIAEAAAALGDAKEAQRARDLLAPCSGRMVVAGISMVLGPVDGYLALAEAVTGDLASATAHADHAREQAEGWGFPAYLTWLRRQRDRHGF